MTVKVTLEFPSIDVAIVALAKFVGGKAARAAEQKPAAAEAPAANPAAVAAVSAAPPAEKQKRRQRADKGQPRGEYGPRTMTVVAETVGPPITDSFLPAEQPAAAQTPVGDGDAPRPTPAAAAVPSDTDAQAALEKLFNATNIQTAQEVMSRFGCKRLKELKPEQRADFIAKCEEVAGGAQA